jgi:hypothetical protein
MPEQPVVLGIEVAPDALALDIASQRHCDVPLLADVAKIERASDLNVRIQETLALETHAGLPFEIGKDRVQPRMIRIVQIGEMHAHIVVPHAGVQHAERAEGSGQARYVHPPAAERATDGRAMQGTAPPAATSVKCRAL